MRLLRESSQASKVTSTGDASIPTKKSVKLVVTPTPAAASDPTGTAGRQHASNNEVRPWDPFNRNCVSRSLFDTIGDKWAMLILLSIEDGPLRNGEIKDRVQGISPKVLTQRLSVLVDDGLVTRTSHHQIPPRVDYELTDLGESVIAPVKSVYEWTTAHMGEVMDFRKQDPKAS